MLLQVNRRTSDSEAHRVALEKQAADQAHALQALDTSASSLRQQLRDSQEKAQRLEAEQIRKEKAWAVSFSVDASAWLRSPASCVRQASKQELIEARSVTDAGMQGLTQEITANKATLAEVQLQVRRFS